MLSARICSKSLVLIAAFSLAGLGCQGQSTAPTPPAQLKMGFRLASSDLASLITTVTLEMRFFPPDSSVTRTLNLINGEVHDTISVGPADSIMFALRAFDAQGNLLYIGRQTRVVRSGEQVEVNILLSPNPELLMLRVGPFHQSSPIGTEDSVYVDVYNVDSLYGAAFRIRYDTLVLTFSHAAEGDFVRGTPPVATFSGVIKDTLDYVAYFVTRVRGSQGIPTGVSTFGRPGRLATFFFTKRGTGTSPVTIDRKTVALTRPDGRPVNKFDTIVLEPATVNVR